MRHPLVHIFLLHKTCLWLVAGHAQHGLCFLGKNFNSSGAAGSMSLQPVFKCRGFKLGQYAGPAATLTSSLDCTEKAEPVTPI